MGLDEKPNRRSADLWAYHEQLAQRCEYEFSAIRREIEFSSKQSAQATALMAPTVTRNAEEFNELKKEFESFRQEYQTDKDERYKRIVTWIGSIAVIVLAAVIIAGLVVKSKP